MKTKIYNMILTSLELINFRNYKDIKVNFGKQKNILFGENAQGKTNIIEAIHVLCISKSFRTSKEGDLLYFTEKETQVKGCFLSDKNIEKEVDFIYSQEEGKKLRLDRKRITRYHDYIGQFPVVLLSPEDYKITLGAPGERRRFVDILLSQIDAKYFVNLQQYNRILKQKNKILFEGKSRKYDYALIEPWNINQAICGSYIIQARSKFAKDFPAILQRVYRDLTLYDEALTFSYRSFLRYENSESLASFFLSELYRLREEERLKATTLVGPHRDDFRFQINNKELRKYGSRGQHKTALIALKIAEHQFIKEKKKETPVLLLDDLFSDLDPVRENKVLEKLEGIGQIFVTTTRNPARTENNREAWFQIKNGKITLF